MILTLFPTIYNFILLQVLTLMSCTMKRSMKKLWNSFWKLKKSSLRSRHWNFVAIFRRLLLEIIITTKHQQPSWNNKRRPFYLKVIDFADFKILAMDILSVKITVCWLEVLNTLMLFIYPFVPLSVIFVHFSGLFPVPYRISCVTFRTTISFKCSKFLLHDSEIVNFLIKTHNKNFGPRNVLVFLLQGKYEIINSCLKCLYFQDTVRLGWFKHTGDDEKKLS